ncbi:phosphomannomutase/phosphoglucomutase [Helicobacter sp. T3_23-1056]
MSAKVDMNMFREYDIRGIFGENLSQEVVQGIGVMLGKYIKTNGGESVAIGYDARTHSPILYEWLKDGFIQSKIKVYFMGMIPTPVAYFATFASEKFANANITSSVMITGSHNPPQYNGFKITIDKKPFYGEDIKKIGQELANNIDSMDFGTQSEKAQNLDALKSYEDFLVEHFARLKDFPYQIVLDYGNGVGALGLENVLKRLNIKHTSLYENPDGTFPNHHPDPSEKKNLTDILKYMGEHKTPIGIAFDGDADRIALMTQNHLYKGDEMAILFARNIAKTTPNPTIIGEVKCSQIMYDEINSFGRAIMYKTGHSNLKVKLKELDAQMAAEMSGHLFFNDRYFGYDDALYAALRALELFLDSTPSEVESSILSLPKLYSTDEEKISTTEEAKFTQIANLKERLSAIARDSRDITIHTESHRKFPRICEIIDIDGVRVVFENGWGLVRASNTTPVLVTRFEAKSKEELEQYKNAIFSVLRGC